VKRVGLAARGLLVALGVLALLHVVASGDHISPDLLVRALRVAVDVPFEAASRLARTPGA
jgi:hypothetical protein